MNKLQLLVATHNPAKVAEFNRYFSYYYPELKLLSLTDLGINDEAEENAITFEGNARRKAAFYASLSHQLTLADDGGFEIDALNGEPGVLSRRWPGYEADDKELVELTMKKLKDVPSDKRGAQIRVSVALANPAGKIIAQIDGVTRGIIAEVPALIKNKGFPYRAVLLIPQFNKLYQDLTETEHEKVNHRRGIVNKLVPQIKEYFLNK